MRKTLLLLSFATFLSISLIGQQEVKTISFNSLDGIEITADLYEIENKEAPLILLFHQASYSRGEYLKIAPVLNNMGFRCLAIDQRSGNAINGVENETFKRAAAKNKGTQYADAAIDLEAALKYAKENLSANKIIVWGSSYSSSLVFYLASKYPEEVKGILSFSPGEYFLLNGKTVRLYAAKVKCPVFVTSAKNEKGAWKDIYEAIPGDKRFFLPEHQGLHGSKALWPTSKGSQDYWQAVEAYLSQFK